MGNTNAQPVFLPQNDPDIGTRRRELAKAEELYQLAQNKFGFNDEQVAEWGLVNVPPVVSTFL